MSAVEVCPDCDIAGCTHIRNRTGAFAAPSQSSVSVEELVQLLDSFFKCDGFDNNTFSAEEAASALIDAGMVRVKGE